MKCYGIVIEYNGVYGIIKGIDEKDYTLLDKNVIDQNIKKGDHVIFEVEEVNKFGNVTNIARFVKLKD